MQEATCQECGERQRGVRLRQRVNPRNFHVEKLRLCNRCAGRLGFSDVEGMGRPGVSAADYRVGRT